MLTCPCKKQNAHRQFAEIGLFEYRPLPKMGYIRFSYKL